MTNTPTLRRRFLQTVVLGGSFALVGCKFGDGSSIGIETEDDSPLSERVRQALRENSQTSRFARHISVSSEGDVVKLAGALDNDRDVWIAEEVASRVEGVRFVANALFVH